ncbi:phenylalanine--tRNA ligase subunit beta [Spongiibacter sp. KMU-166]|uniref:Phenylalanine--tRNA ligase beta subunit n=1 Tax=Spongiibacter thalassae TaxID=2721624 RepID=A0ABX1GF37_9GAMM|nr:phenylalanine--tRNA ligase subunit beta [Spongiibacter thalassae]NKI17107.1 phenylalanine--tRNA ligase subunit beta [Spongiibacter thalassae]
MKFSEQWLREWVNPEVNSEELAEQLTMAGLEVDAIDPVAGEFSGVVVAEILSASPHPYADKLQVCQVATGGETVQIVCGAANARPGIKVPLATVGAVLPGNFKIKKAKLRGVESFGMLCAEEELGMAESSDGLLELAADAEVGLDIREFLGLDDQIIELGLTPNRADCLSIRGIAREAAVLNDLPLVEPVVDAVAPTHGDRREVLIEAPEDCPRYVGRILKNVDLSVPSPQWLRERLRRCGLRSKDAVVDVTNYVLLELGQPMHAFDLAHIDGNIHVRHAGDGETLRLLGGQDLTLKPDSLVIADDSKALALAGIMGGEGSAVSAATTDIFLEAAFFAPERLAGRARSYGLHTDSSHRFERGVDFELPQRAIERATGLIRQICGGEAGPLVVAEGALPQRDKPVTLRAPRIEKMLGLALTDQQVEKILAGLGMVVTREGETWQVEAPSWRFDIDLEVDLLEELARIYGYNRLPVKPINADLHIRPAPETVRSLSALRQQMLAKGYQEVITYSFVDPQVNQLLSDSEQSIPLLNPISSDMAIMRDSLLPGLLKAAEHNSKRQQSRLRMFEVGQRFIKTGENIAQTETFAALLSGRREPENWASDGAIADYFDLKGDLEALFGSAATQLQFAAQTYKAFHPGQSASVSLSGEIIGRIGALHPQLQSKFDLPNPVYFFELELAALQRRDLPAFTSLSRQPEVRRDLALLLPRDVAAQDLLQCARTAAGESLIDLKLFDIYQGKGIDPERKSIGLGLTYRHSSRTLNEEEVTLSIETVLQSLQERFGASLRN